jgi:hypothetical protein
MAFNPFWEVVELNNVMKSDYRRSERTNRTAVSDGGSDTVKRTAFRAPERTAISGRQASDGGSERKNLLGGRVLPSLPLLISYFD